MELVGYEETLLSAKHSVEFFDDFEDWTRIEAEEETPTFENFQVRANQALTEKWMSAEIAWSKESSIVAVDKLESNWVKTDGLPRNKISQLIKQFCEKREISPTYLVVMNICEESAWRLLTTINDDGYIMHGRDAYTDIMTTWVGKMAGKIGQVQGIDAFELNKANQQGVEILEGPSLIFEYKLRVNLPTRYGGRVFRGR